MRKNYYSTNLILSHLAVVAVVIGATSCIDDTYSLDKDIDMEMNIGGALTLPIGSTKPIALGDMLDPDELDMLILENGIYKVSVEDKIEVEIEKLAGDDEIAIDAYVKSETIEVEFDNPDIDPIDLNVPSSSVNVTPDVDLVDLGDGDELKQELDISPTINLPNEEGITIPYDGIYGTYDGQIPVSLGNTALSVSFGGGMTCPDGVDAITEITIGSTATVDIDVSVLSDRFDNTFVLTIPSLKIEFPAGFVLDGKDNIVEKSNLTSVGDKVSFSFVITKYDEKIVPNPDGSIPSIGGDIECTISDYFTVEGTTNGLVSAQTDIMLNLEAMIEVSDMDLEVSGIEVAVPGMEADELCEDDIEIDLPSIIKSITSVTLDSKSNELSISISPLSAPSGLSASELISLRFPTNKFVLATDSDITKSDDYYSLNIPVSSILGTTTYNKSIEIEQILFSDCQIVEGEESNTLLFNPEIDLIGATIALSGDVSVSEFNDFIGKTTIVTTTVSGNQLEVKDADIVTDDYIAYPDASVYDIDQLVENIPEELERIDRIEFYESEDPLVDNSVYVDINLEVELTGTDSDLSFDNYTISFPKFIKFAANEEIDDENILTFVDDKFIPDATNGNLRVFTRRYEIDYLDFTDTKYAELINDDGNLQIIDQVSLEGGIKLASGDVNSGELSSTVDADINFSISKMVVGKVYGKVNPELPESEPQEIDLGDLSESFTDGELSAVLSNPVITIDVVNSLAIPIEIYLLEINPTKDGSATTDINGDPIYLALEDPIYIDAATEDSDAATTVIISANATESASTDGVEYVQMEDLKYLLCDLPDKVEIAYEARVTGDDHMIDLYKDYSFTINYSVDIPLSFDEFNLDYTTTIEELGESLADFAEMINTLELELTATNTLPIAISIYSITPLDADGEKITSLPAMLDESTSTIKANGEESTVKLTIANNDDRDLTKLDALEIHIGASIDSSVGGSLEESQSLSFKVVARIPDGVYIDGNALAEDDDESEE